jgi:hypothetical protein
MSIENMLWGAPRIHASVDHVVVLGETHLRRILTKYAVYYNELRTHRSLNKDAPIYARSSTWAASHLRLSSAASITTIAESSFQYTHPSVLRISPTRRRPGLSPRTNQNMHRVHVRVVDVHSIYLRIEAGSLECGHKRVSGGPKSGFLAPMDLDGYV